ncbi:DinB family protein [Amycolatopsis aidingensis]|uniref:DinB family protein n=1 Tax=Amycolatopsis aidingensis TaxID=2842453 RepID=UPI001C0BEB8E|nr:DinB family protein [Amycolatopsis aidingensis]
MTEAPMRPEPDLAGGERDQLVDFLNHQRGTVVWKCSGLTEEQARRQLVPSELTTIATLLAHLRWVEHYWFEVVLDGQPDSWEEALRADKDAEFRPGLTEPMSTLIEDYRRQCAASDEIVAKLDLAAELPFRGRRINPRWVLIHMIEETARHAGHIDLLRELTDGFTGQ